MNGGQFVEVVGPRLAEHRDRYTFAGLSPAEVHSGQALDGIVVRITVDQTGWGFEDRGKGGTRPRGMSHFALVRSFILTTGS